MYIKKSEIWILDGIESLKDIDEKQLINTIKLLSKEVDEYCNTRFEPTKDKYTLDLREKFHTRRQPLLEVSRLSLLGNALNENQDYFVYPESSRVEICLPDNRYYKKSIELDYLYGYSEVPSTVKQVIIDLLKLDTETKGVKMSTVQSENWDGEYSYSLHSSKDFTPAELRKNILSRLDIFKVEPYSEARNTRTVKARLV